MQKEGLLQEVKTMFQKRNEELLDAFQSQITADIVNFAKEQVQIVSNSVNEQIEAKREEYGSALEKEKIKFIANEKIVTKFLKVFYIFIKTFNYETCRFEAEKLDEKAKSEIETLIGPIESIYYDFNSDKKEEFFETISSESMIIIEHDTRFEITKDFGENFNQDYIFQMCLAIRFLIPEFSIKFCEPTDKCNHYVTKIHFSRNFLKPYYDQYNLAMETELDKLKEEKLSEVVKSLSLIKHEGGSK